MTKADFVWTVGYNGPVALVNRNMKRSHGSADVETLLAEGFLRAALCTALWDADQSGAPLDQFVDRFNAATGHRMGLDDIKRLVGVYQVPDKAVKVQLI